MLFFNHRKKKKSKEDLLRLFVPEQPEAVPEKVQRLFSAGKNPAVSPENPEGFPEGNSVSLNVSSASKVASERRLSGEPESAALSRLTDLAERQLAVMKQNLETVQDQEWFFN